MIRTVSLIVASLILAGWLHWLTGRVQRLLTHAEQLQASGAALLALVPGKSAPHTEAPPDVVPKRWWTRLRASADAREATVRAATDAFAAAVDDVLTTTAPPRAAGEPKGEMTVKVALTAEPHPDDTPTEVLDQIDSSGEVPLSTTLPANPGKPRSHPTPGPDTSPAATVIDQWHRDVTTVIPAPDAADVALARFGLRPHLTAQQDQRPDGGQP